MGTKPTQIPGRQILVRLIDVEPAVWRRVTVPGHWHLGRVHDVLQVAMGWHDGHLHEFETGGRRIGPPDPYGQSAVTREAVVRLHEVMPNVGAAMTYMYDFGDGWVHELVVEALLAPLARAGCVAGAGACPPEDCGGPWGYVEMLAALADPAHEDHEHFKEWVGGEFDPVNFDQQATDLALSRLR